jgi:two-component system, OmpR family, response regulator
MLVLSRRLNEKLVFPTINAAVRVVSVKPGVVRLGIEAPDSVPVFREELLGRAEFQAPPQVDHAQALCQLRHLFNNRLNASAVGLALLRRQLELGRTEDAKATKLSQEVQALRDGVEAGSAPARPAHPKAARRALLVEDDRNECELLAGYLRLAGLEVTTAGDGADALDYLRAGERPDVVLLDMLLPRCDGPTTVRAIRQDPAYSGLRIYGVTGAPAEDFGLDEGPRGIDRWFRKPLNPEALLRELTQEWVPTA